MSPLPVAWKRGVLGDVAAWGSGGTPRARDPRYYGGPIPWAVIGDLPDGVIHSTTNALTPEGLAASSAKLVPAGAVLIAMYGSIGKLGITGVEMSTNQAIAFAVPRPELIEKSFLFYYLLSQRKSLAGAGKGATQQNIGQGTLKSWPIALPSLSEQRRIVEILENHLSRLDAAGQLVRQSAKRLDILQRQVVEAALLGGTAERAPGSDQLPDEGVDDGSLACLPAGWRWQRLGQLADVVGGVTKDSSKQNDPAFVEVPYLRVANVQRGRLELDNVTKIRVSPAKAEALTLRRGDVLLNEGGDRNKLGRGWVWEEQVPNCIHQNHVFRARVRDHSIDPYLLSWAANTLGGPWCERNGKQSVNLASISLSRIRLMPVPVPPRSLQAQLVRAIGEHLTANDRLRSALRSAELRSAGLRRSLLQAAFSGRLTSGASKVETTLELTDA